jgi:hypothetical protein
MTWSIEPAGEFELFDKRTCADLADRLRSAGFVRVYNPQSMRNSTPYEYILEHDLTVYCREHNFIKALPNWTYEKRNIKGKTEHVYSHILQ